MKSFDIPEIYKSEIISKVKSSRKLEDPRKRDFSPSSLDFGNVRFLIARHFGFCYGVENAIEISYKAIRENKGKRIYLLSQMIHNPFVNEDLQGHGIHFLQDTEGNQLIPFSELKKEDVVIIPAFGTTVELENKLKDLGVDIQKYNTTCPFVEKVWKRSAKLGEDQHTIIIHGKNNHEETRATFSHSSQNASSIVVKDLNEVKELRKYILGELPKADFYKKFENQISANFDLDKDFTKVGVVNQTTMLATETQEIADFIKTVMAEKFGEDNIKNHFADTRDTLCYATNDNQNATLELLKQSADFAIVVGGYNSSNTSHIVELLEEKFKTYFISSVDEINDDKRITHYDLHTNKEIQTDNFLSEKSKPTVILTSGASCPDAMIDEVLLKVLEFFPGHTPLEEVLSKF